MTMWSFVSYNKRIVFSDPQKNLEQFDIAPGMKVAEFGSGAGYYSLLLSRLVGQTGRVLALDINADLLITLKREASRAHIYNVEIIQADLEKPLGTKLKEGVVDRGIIANILFHIEHKEAFVTEIARVMHTGGKVLVIDWADSFGGLGPEKKVIITAEACRALFETHGFAFEKVIQAGSHHYGFVFKKV